MCGPAIEIEILLLNTRKQEIYLVWKVMLWKKIWSSPMLSLPPLPEFCSESQSGQSKMEANVSPMQSVNHVLTKLEVEQMLGGRAGELLEGGGEEKEPVVEGESSLPFPSTTTSAD